MNESEKSKIIYTIGHSSRSLQDFIRLLQVYEVRLLCDVRVAPGSRKFPQYNKDHLSNALREIGIQYVHLRDLGGFRKPSEASPNTGWLNDSFRGYADYMMTDQFKQALDYLISMAEECTTAIMCSEALYWRCHRKLISDALTVKGFKVRHILHEGDAPMHTLTEFAHVQGDLLIYPEKVEHPKLPGF